MDAYVFSRLFYSPRHSHFQTVCLSATSSCFWWPSARSFRECCWHSHKPDSLPLTTSQMTLLYHLVGSQNQQNVSFRSIKVSQTNLDSAFYTTFHIGSSYNVTWITPFTSNVSALTHPTQSWLFSQSTYRIRLVDSDGLTVEQFPGLIHENGNIQSVKLRSPCEQCMLLVEQVMSNGKVFRSCSDVNVVHGNGMMLDLRTWESQVPISVKSDEQCSQRGSMMNTTCQCESGFTGDQCQHYGTSFALSSLCYHFFSSLWDQWWLSEWGSLCRTARFADQKTMLLFLRILRSTMWSKYNLWYSF